MTFKKRKFINFLNLFFIFFFSLLNFFPAFAEPTKTRPFYQSSRALAMGDAYTAYGEGFESFFYNPAGVARPATMTAKYFDLSMIGSSRIVPLISDDYLQLTNMAAIVKKVAEKKDKPYAIGIEYLPQLQTKNFSVGFIGRTYNEATVDGATLYLDYYSYADLAAYAQIGFALWGGVVKVGVGGKVLNRAEVYKSYSPAEYASGLSFNNQWKEGIGYGADAGILMTIPNDLQPTLGIAVQDIGETRLKESHSVFTGSSAAQGSPKNLSQRVNVGLSTNPKHARKVKSVYAIEVKDVLTLKSSVFERLHAGWEMRIHDAVSLRLGVNQTRYWTAGFGIKVASVGIEFATYGENVAFDEGGRRDDRKYVLRYKSEF